MARSLIDPKNYLHIDFKRLSDSFVNIHVIDKIQKYENSKYESEIVIDLEPFGLKDCVLQGFSDHEYKIKDALYIDDLKTGNADNKDSKYGDTDKYYQTRLYAYQRENEGHIIGRCQVIHLGRKGNNFILNDKNQLRLTGRIDYIETPYIRSEVEKYLKEEVVSIAKDISAHYKVYKSFCDEV